MIKILGITLAVCIGLSLGLIGGGGSILAVPTLVYVMGVNPKSAIAMSLAIVGTVSLIGVIPHWKHGNVNFRTAIIFIPTAMIGAYLGAKLTTLPFISDTFQFICFAIVMAIASFLMIYQGNKKTHCINPHLKQSAQLPPKILPQWLMIPAEGLGVGILTGFVGVGGGFLIVPTLVLLAGISIKEAIGTSLLIIAANSATGFIGYVGEVEIDWNLVVSFAIAANIGTLLGGYLTQYIDAKQLQKAFGYFVLAVAVFVLIKH